MNNPNAPINPVHLLYECGICGSLHPWGWNGDCRDNAHRYMGADDYAERNDVNWLDIEVRSWQERMEIDAKEQVQ